MLTRPPGIPKRALAAAALAVGVVAGVAPPAHGRTISHDGVVHVLDRLTALHDMAHDSSPARFRLREEIDRLEARLLAQASAADAVAARSASPAAFRAREAADALRMLLQR